MHELVRDLKFRVSKTLKGKAEAEEIGIIFTRVELRNDEGLPYFKKGSHLIFFLRHGRKDKGEPDCWIEADMWFGVQLYNRVLGRALQSLAEREPPQGREDATQTERRSR